MDEKIVKTTVEAPAAAKKAAAPKAEVKKAPAKKAPARKTMTKKAPVKKAPARKTCETLRRPRRTRRGRCRASAASVPGHRCGTGRADRMPIPP